jgi:hypothetical protein
MTPQQIMRMALDPAVILEAQGLTPPWQQQFLHTQDRRILLCCTRGAGKPQRIGPARVTRSRRRACSAITSMLRFA